MARDLKYDDFDEAYWGKEYVNTSGPKKPWENTAAYDIGKKSERADDVEDQKQILDERTGRISKKGK